MRRDPDAPITDCHMRPYSYEYVISAKVTDPVLVRASLDVVAAEIQEVLFWDGAVTTGHFVMHSRNNDRITFVLKRYGCEEDYHDCYAGSHGHNGSDRNAIAQLQGEILEAIEDCPTEVWLEDVLVEERLVLNS